MHSNFSQYLAVSFDTVTFQDLQYFLHKESLTLERIEPEEFFQINQSHANFINLVTNDMSLRKSVSDHLDLNNLTRFNYVHPSSVVLNDYKRQGLFVYPQCSIYNNVNLGNDIIFHSNSGIGHKSSVASGTYISGGVHIGGGTSIGKFCWIGIGTTVMDKIRITDHVKIAGGSVIRKNILNPGTYAVPFLTKKINNTDTD